jgi:TP901-1 family phage major tail protein
MQHAGKDFLLKVDVGSGTFTTIAGLRTSQMSLEREAVDVTTHGSNQWSEKLAAAGIKSMKLSASGVYDSGDTTLDILEDALMAGTLLSCKLVDATASAKSYTASFFVTGFERGGEYNAEQTFSISLESSGAVTVS